jgi:hypothetical protein
MSAFQIATFRANVTPPPGHPLCAGWMPPALGITDQLYANGIILSDGGAPIVLCAVDWCEISNRSYHAWQNALAQAVGTTPDRVAVHTMHPHCTPWPDEVAQKLISEQNGIRPLMNVAWCDDALRRTARAAGEARSNPSPLTDIATGRAQVEQVASNRRIMGEDGKVKAVRWTRTKEPEVRAEPEGEIDPWLKTISFWNKDEKLAVLHFYAVHPSSYEDSYVTPDFTGLARERRAAEDGVAHLYFTECAGDITAGKYNDGATELREVFTERIYDALVASEDNAQRHPLRSLEWKTQPLQLPPREDEPVEHLETVLSDESVNTKLRSRAALILAYHERQATPITLAALELQTEGGPPVTSVHLPGEAFMEYQYFAQQQRPDDFVVVPSYGDCGPGYICLAKSFDEGGYEPKDSFVSGSSEMILKESIQKLLI